MPRKKLVLSSNWPYHVTARVSNREHFPGELKFIWKVLTSELQLQTFKRNAKIHAFVLMPNHFHLMISTPDGNITDVMRDVMSSATKIINVKNHRTGHLFGGRYKWSIITNSLYFAHAMKYVYRNPVKAGICEKVAAYPYSTYGGLVGACPLPVSICSPQWKLDRNLITDPEQLDSWLNTPHKAEENDAIKKALLRKNFKLPVKRNYKKNFKLSEVT